VRDAQSQRRGWSKLEELFGVDLRSLALFRIGAAAMILADLALRARYIEENYTDAGVEPRTIVLDYLQSGTLPAVHLLGGSYWFQVLLFVIAAVFALMLLIGWRTRIATVASWYLLDSLHRRRFLFLDGGDLALRLVLFWSIFLPLGARYAMDARRRARTGPSLEHGTVLSAASAALLLQVAYIYFFGGVLKAGPEWQAGTALYYALREDWWARPLGAYLRQFPDLMWWLTWAARDFEIVGSLLLFSPIFTGVLRTIMVVALWGFLMAIGVCLQVGLFPWICGVALLPFVPAWAWDRLPRSLGWQGRQLPAPAASPRPPAAALKRAAWYAINTAILLLLVLITVINVGTVDERIQLPPALSRIVFALRLDQHWFMYAPSPPRFDFHFALRGRLRGGRLVELDQPGGAPAWQRVMQVHREYRWKIYLEAIKSRRWPQHLSAYASWLCRRWNATPGNERLDEIVVFLVSEEMLPNNTKGPPLMEVLVQQRCPP
jgi:hypothetical protein